MFNTMFKVEARKYIMGKPHTVRVFAFSYAQVRSILNMIEDNHFNYVDVAEYHPSMNERITNFYVVDHRGNLKHDQTIKGECPHYFTEYIFKMFPPQLTA